THRGSLSHKHRHFRVETKNYWRGRNLPKSHVRTLVNQTSGDGKMVGLMRPPYKFAVGLRQISDTLIACGYTKLDDQAKALGVSRSTAWTIVKKKHKLDRLNNKTITRILANSETPQVVRAVVQQYLSEKVAVAFR